MQIAVLQPPYPAESSAAAARECLDWMRARLREFEAGAVDLVLLPEYATVPGLDEPGVLFAFAESEGRGFREELRAESARLGAVLVAGDVRESAGRWFNTVRILDGRSGPVREWGYDKTHLTGAERELGFVPGDAPGRFDLGDVLLGVATCLDVYFPEYIEALAGLGVDLILSPSYQRSEAPERIRRVSCCRALDSGAWFVRAAYAMPDPGRGGTSLAVSPAGTVIAEAGPGPAVLRFALAPKQRFRKPASHGKPAVVHRELLEAGRRPGLYRPRADALFALQRLGMPRLCAHRGLSAVCPENTVPAFAAAAALPRVSEIEFDLWLSRDGVPVVCHDPDVSRTTNGKGRVDSLDWPDIRRLDAGAVLGAAWRGVGVPRLEQVLDAVGGQVVLNVHLKTPGAEGRLLRLLRDALAERGLTRTAYIAGDRDVLEAACRIAPEIERCCLAAQGEPDRQIEIALEYGCRRIQFMRQVAPEQIGRARELGLVCNLFWSDEPEDARRYLAAGIQVLLTNAGHVLAAAGIGAARAGAAFGREEPRG